MVFYQKGKGWRYQVKNLLTGKRVSKAWFPTKREALEAERQRLNALSEEAIRKNIVTFSDLGKEYLEHAARQFVGKSTVCYKKIVFNRLLTFLGGDMEMDQITPPMLERFLRTREANTSYNRHRKELAAFYEYCWRRHRTIVPENPFYFMPKLPEPKFERVIPTQEEWEKMLMAAGADRPLLLVLYYTLGRINSVLGLRWQDVDWQEEKITLRHAKSGNSEVEGYDVPVGSKLRVVLEHLWRTRKQDQWIFFNEKTGFRYTYRPKLMRTICKTAKVKHFGFHAIRHFANSKITRSYDPKTAQKLMGHKNLATTFRYCHSIGNDEKAAVEIL
jgi:integrase